MNERIEQLAREAAHSTRMSYNNAYWWPMMDEIPEHKAWREKFAELIIKECAWAADFAEDTSPGEYVLKHFGVES